jgi:hypothetical protein
MNNIDIYAKFWEIGSGLQKYYTHTQKKLANMLWVALAAWSIGFHPRKL